MQIDKSHQAAPSLDPASLMAGLIDSETLASALSIRRETLSRMAGDATRGFPKGLRIGMAVYYNFEAVKRWIRKETGATESDASLHSAHFGLVSRVDGQLTERCSHPSEKSGTDNVR